MQPETPLQAFERSTSHYDKELLAQEVEANHQTEHQKEAKLDAKVHGRAGRFRGKAKARQNNKARGGKMAR